MASSDSEIKELLNSRVDACQEKDIDRLMSLYSPDIVYYDVVPPLQFTGSADVRRNFVRWFDEYDGPIDPGGLFGWGPWLATTARPGRMPIRLAAPVIFLSAVTISASFYHF